MAYALLNTLALPQLEAFQKAKAARAAKSADSSGPPAPDRPPVTFTQQVAVSSKPQVSYTLATGPIQFATDQSTPSALRQETRPAAVRAAPPQDALQAAAPTDRVHPLGAAPPLAVPDGQYTVSNGTSHVAPRPWDSSVPSSLTDTEQPGQSSGAPSRSRLPGPMPTYRPAQGEQGPRLEASNGPKLPEVSPKRTCGRPSSQWP